MKETTTKDAMGLVEAHDELCKLLNILRDSEGVSAKYVMAIEVAVVAIDLHVSNGCTRVYITPSETAIEQTIR